MDALFIQFLPVNQLLHVCTEQTANRKLLNLLLESRLLVLGMFSGLPRL